MISFLKIKKISLGIAWCLLMGVGFFGCAPKAPDINLTINSDGTVRDGNGNIIGQNGRDGKSGEDGQNVNNPPGPGTTHSKCETDASNPLCKIVLTGASGDLTLPGQSKVSGYFQNTYWPDGKLKSTSLYSDKSLNKLLWESDIIYNPSPNDTILTLHSTLSSNQSGIMDYEYTVDNTYNNDKTPATVITNVKNLLTNDLGKMETHIFYVNVPTTVPQGWPAGSTKLVAKLTTQYSSKAPANIQAPNAFTFDYSFLNADGLPIETRMLWAVNPWSNPPSAAVQTFESVETFTYNGKILNGSTKKMYDCSKSIMNNKSCVNSSWLDPYSGTATILPLAPYVIYSTVLNYSDGKLANVVTNQDGDPDPNGSNAYKFGSANTKPYAWECNITYDPANKKVIAKFPEMILKIIGLSETDKIQTLACDDKNAGTNAVGSGGNFTFDEWKYLWQATNQEEPK